MLFQPALLACHLASTIPQLPRHNLRISSPNRSATLYLTRRYILPPHPRENLRIWWVGHLAPSMVSPPPSHQASDAQKET